ncbi:MAG: AmmeMemoRadiSam system radical SAM enzyme [Desulfuromonadaceae bacterium]|nr:AmmeMemoRadiSam system radical SAM enzyme [Desulfuromonadaceae bacterium]
MHVARFWHAEDNNRVRCQLCRHFCLIAPGKRGLCRVRENVSGELKSLVYGRSVANAIDPVEKKPLFHFHPGSLSYSIATVGCSFRCLHCQNHQISQWSIDHDEIPGEYLPPVDVARRARSADCLSISYTYTEPTIFYEYAHDTAILARKAQLKNVFVTNGYISAPALDEIAPFIDAANIDLKGFSEKFYHQVVGAKLSQVLDSLRAYRKHDIWLEITTLIIPGKNDDLAELRDLATFIYDELGPQTPWHVTAFYPTWKLLDSPPTPPETLTRVRDIGLEVGLHYVYTGNIPGNAGENTCCPQCHRVVIERHGFSLHNIHLHGGCCAYCGTTIDGVGLDDLDESL